MFDSVRTSSISKTTITPTTRTTTTTNETNEDKFNKKNKSKTFGKKLRKRLGLSKRNIIASNNNNNKKKKDDRQGIQKFVQDRTSRRKLKKQGTTTTGGGATTFTSNTSSSASSVSSSSTSSSIQASLSYNYHDDDEEEEEEKVEIINEDFDENDDMLLLSSYLDEFKVPSSSGTLLLDYNNHRLQVVEEDSESSTSTTTTTETSTPSTIVATNESSSSSSTTTTTSNPIVQVDRFSFSTNLIRQIQSHKETSQNRHHHHQNTFFITSNDKTTMMNDMNLDFTETLVQQFGLGKGIVEAHLLASNHLIHECLLVDKVVQTTDATAMPGTIQDTIFHALESFLYPRLSVLYNNINNMDFNDDDDDDVLTPKDATEIIIWIDTYMKLISNEMPEVIMMKEWEIDMIQLTQYYLNKAVRFGMKELLRNAWELQQQEQINDVRQNNQLHMVTGLPEQIAYMYTQQINTAKQNLLSSSSSSSVLTISNIEQQVVSICNEELSILVSDMQLKIASEWKDIPVCLFCAIINDANRMTDHCEERNEKYFFNNDDDKNDDDNNNNNDITTLEQQQQQGYRLVKDLTELSLYATKYLCQRIMSDLCKPKNDILTSVGDENWERDDTCIVMERTIATFQDFFEDLQVWLMSSDYYFSHVLKNCFELTIQIYLESFFGNTISRGIQDPQNTADLLRRDFVRLVTFFNGANFDKYLDYDDNEEENVGYRGVRGRRGGHFYTEIFINNSLRILQNMASVLSPMNHPDFCHDDIIAILQRFDGNVDDQGDKMRNNKDNNTTNITTTNNNTSSSSRRDGSAAVLHLAGLRNTRRLNETESLIWIKAIAKAKKSIAMSRQEQQQQQMRNKEMITIYPSRYDNNLTYVQVPDIRNSRFIRNLRPPRPTMMTNTDRCISIESLPHAKSTLRLLGDGEGIITRRRRRNYMNSNNNNNYYYRSNNNNNLEKTASKLMLFDKAKGWLSLNQSKFHSTGISSSINTNNTNKNDDDDDDDKNNNNQKQEQTT